MITWSRQTTPPWLLIALGYRGLREVPGKSTAPKIALMLKKLKAWWSDDETPWCGVFVGYCLQEARLPYPSAWYRAKGYSDFGSRCLKDAIPLGAICVKSRKGGGHVFFAVARSRDGSIIYGLGGNQGNSVNIVPFSINEIDDVRWPVSSGPRIALPVIGSTSEIGAVAAGSEA